MKVTERIQTIRTADDVNLRCGTWENANHPYKATVLLLHGRTEFLEKYSEFTHELLAKHYRVISFDWRGQGLSQRYTGAEEKGHTESYEAYLCDLDSVVHELVDPADTTRLFLIAHSMGGHIALRYLHDHAGRVDKALLLSPMFGIRFSPVQKIVVDRITARAIRRGRAKDLVMRASQKSQTKLPFKNNLLTSDPIRFARESEQLIEQPALTVGGPTFGWLSASLKSISVLSEKSFTDAITTPIRILTAGADRVVDNKMSIKLCKRLPNCSQSTVAGARHELLMETNAIRDQVWQNIDEFFAFE